MNILYYKDFNWRLSYKSSISLKLAFIIPLILLMSMPIAANSKEEDAAGEGYNYSMEKNQGVKISGTVLDAFNEPMAGVNIIEEGTTNGVTTGVNGEYSITVSSEDSKLIFSFLGFFDENISVGNQRKIDIVMVEDIQALGEIVVVGYGVQKRSDVTGAMARVGKTELEAMPVKDALQAMQGKVSGVDITSNQRPGQTNDIKIRGVRSITAEQGPLYVVDGMVLQTGGSQGKALGSIDNINPNDIESIDILKDASATAIYGSRGANGVIIVTTKQGEEGKVVFNYSGSVTLQKMYDVTEYMDAGEWIEYARLAKQNQSSESEDGTVTGLYPETPTLAADESVWGSVSASFANIEKGWSSGSWNPDDAGNYDWGAHGKQTGVITEHTISASGGSKKLKGYGSFGYLNQSGTIKDQAFTRYTAKASFSAQPKSWIDFGSTINGSYGDQDYGYSFSKSTTGAGDYYSALKGMQAWTVPFDENGDYIRNPAAGDVNIINPINETEYNTHERITLRVAGNFHSQIDLGNIFDPLIGLKYRIQFGPEFEVYRLGKFYDEEGINGDGTNIAFNETYLTNSWTLDNLIFYDKTIAEHKIGITLMQSASAYHHEFEKIKANAATSDELWYNVSSLGTISSFGSGLTEKQMASYMVRGNYNYKEKYLLTASVRWDGASQLSEDNKWASFPSCAIGWRLDQEDFMNSISWVDAFKLRLGYGITGNSAISAYATKGAVESLYYNWGTSSSSLGYVASDPSLKNPAKMGNKDLCWERTTQYNIGTDYTFFDYRIFGSVDVYKTRTDDLLLEMSIPSVIGYTSTYANVGKTKGWGIDIQLNTINIKTTNFSWMTSLTWSKDENEIVELANGSDADIDNKWFVGEGIEVFYDYKYDGIWKTSEKDEAESYGSQPGAIKVKDLDHDGTIDANYDREIVGVARPDWTGGITNTFNYKNLEFSFFIYSRWGNTFESGKLTLDGRFQQRKIDYWIEGTNEGAKYYSPGINGESAPTYNSSMNYQDGSFVKLRNLNFGYNFNKSKLEDLGISSLKVYAQIMNPWMIYSKCDYLDTDLLNYDNNTTSVGSATTTKSIVFGVNMSF